MFNTSFKMVSSIALVMTAGMAMVGCSDRQDAATQTASNATAASTPATLPASMFLTAAPADPQHVAALVADAKDGQEVVVTGRVGGRRDPFVAGRAVMVVTDVSAVTCHAAGDTGCSTPWDYCCVPREQLKGKVASVQVVNEAGQPLETSLKAAGGLQPMKQVVVRGVVSREAGSESLVIHATGIYVAE